MCYSLVDGILMLEKILLLHLRSNLYPADLALFLRLVCLTIESGIIRVLMKAIKIFTAITSKICLFLKGKPSKLETEKYILREASKHSLDFVSGQRF